jgi:nucleoside-diphosphate-sugar epimerase
MMKTLITGAGGFIGRHIIRKIASMPGEHHAIDLNPPLENLPPSIVWHQVDIMNKDALSGLISEIRPQRLLHLAWVTTHGEYWNSAENFRWVEASLNLIRSFVDAGGTRVVGAGSCAEYDWRYGFLSEEVTPLNPATIYGTCKNAFHNMLRQYADAGHFSYAWGRLFFLYGPGEHPSRLIPYTISTIASGKTAQFGSGERIRDFLRVEDAAAAFLALLDRNYSGPVNVASGEPVSIRTLVEFVARKLGRLDLVQLGAVPTAENDPPFLVGDVTKLKKLWVPEYNLETGLNSLIEDYQKAQILQDS